MMALRTQAENVVRVLLAGTLGLLLLARPALAEPAAVREAFRQYVAAIGHQDGATASTLVTAASLAREERLRDLALSAPAELVAELQAADRLAVLRLRHEFTAAELAPLNGADLVRIAVDEAWSSPRPLAVLTVVGVDEAGDAATLRVERGCEPVPIRLVLHREQGRWKLDQVELAGRMQLSPRRSPSAPSAPRCRTMRCCAGSSRTARATSSTRTCRSRC